MRRTTPRPPDRSGSAYKDKTIRKPYRIRRTYRRNKREINAISGNTKHGFIFPHSNRRASIRRKIRKTPHRRKSTGIIMERVTGIEPARPAWKAGILPLNYTRRCNGHYYSQTGANCQGILKNFFLFQCPFPKCVFILYHILHQDAREISQKSFVFSLRFSRYPPLFLSLSNSLK